MDGPADVRLAPLPLAEVREVGSYLAGPGATEDAKRHAATFAFRNAQADFDRFVASAVAGPDLVSVALTIRGGGRDLRSVYTYLPSPLTLLLVCSRNCEDGDLVGVEQTTAKCGELKHEAHWPFGMAEAEMLTRPAVTLFAAMTDSDTRRMRRHERKVRFVGPIASEHEHHPQRKWLPRPGRWRDQERGIRGISVRLGSVTHRWARLPAEPGETP